jgi:iron complex transport system ATP-binding protein
MSRALTDAALEEVGLAGLPERPFGTFSSGEQLRVQLARALVTEPAALLLDEPMASLDIGGRETLVSTLARVAAGPTGAIVLVLHRLDDVPPGVTHALLLREGRVVSAGPVDDVLADAPMSACYGTPLRVARIGDRWSVSAG